MRTVREHLREAGVISLEAVAIECGVEQAAIGPLVRELVDVQKVAVVDGDVLRWSGEGSREVYTPRHLIEGALRVPSATEGERKQVTVLFVDVAHSTKLAGQLDPEAWHEVLDGFFRILTASVHRFEGTVNQYTGDGIMALFGAPVALEDHARRACQAVLHARESLVAYAAEVEESHGIRLATRFGLNTGGVVVGRIGDDLRMDYTAQGQIVALAQRMESIAEPDSCRLTSATAGLVAGYFDVRPIGRKEVKGSPEPIEVFELNGPGQAGTRFDLSRSRGLTRFVGRREEMDRLMALMARSGDGQGQVVGIQGDAGTGKSRLCHEFAEFCREWGLRVFHAQAPAHARRLPLASIQEIVRQIFHITSDDAADVARAKLTSWLAHGEGDAEKAIVIEEFLGLTTTAMRPSGVNADSRQQLILDVMTRSLGQGSVAGPDIVIVEDIHWIDEASSRTLAKLAARTSLMRTMLIANLRPGPRPEWLEAPNAHLLPLLPLGPQSQEELLAALLGPGSANSELARTIAARAGGNPFFMEEMVRMLAETGCIEPVPGGHRPVAAVTGISIPETVHSILASRIDRLDAADKAVLQSAAVIGPVFAAPVLARVCGIPAGVLSGPLERLERCGFLHRQAAETDPRYAFEHQLTHEVALESQLRVARRRIHAAVARAIEEEAGDRIEDVAGEIAFHREEAGEPLAAAAWYRRAAAWASLHEQAAGIAHWRKVRELSKSVEPGQAADRLLHEACLQLLRLSWRQGFGEFDEIEAEGLAAANRLGDPLAAVLVRLIAAQASGGSGGKYREWPSRLRETESLARECGDPRAIVSTRWLVAYAHWVIGDIAGCLELLDAIDPLAAAEPGPGLLGMHVGSMSGMMRSIAVAWQGKGREAVIASERAIKLTRADDRREEHGWALAAAAEIALVSGEHRNSEAPDLDRAVADAIGIAERLGSPFSRATTLDIGVASAHLHFGRNRDAIDALRESLRTIRDHGTYVEGEARVLARLADALGRVGEFDEARRLVAEAIDRARELGTAHYEALALTVSAKLGLETIGPGYAAAASRELRDCKALIERTAALWLLGPIGRIENTFGDRTRSREAAG